MREGTATLIRREDYAAPTFWIRTVDLCFDLDPAKTIVTGKMGVERNRAVAHGPLRLHGEDLNVLRVLIDGVSVSFRNEPGYLVIDNAPDADFELDHPQHLRAGQEHHAQRALHLGRQLLHPVRGRRLPPHHLFP